MSHITIQGAQTAMKKTAIAIITTGIIVLFVAASPQHSQQKGVDQHKHMQMMEMMQDSTMMDMMMDHIASDPHMRMMMMHKIMNEAKSDSASMMQLCKTMMDEKDMRSCMMKMKGGKKMNDDSMMKHHGMPGKPSTPQSDTTKGSSHGEHHQ